MPTELKRCGLCKEEKPRSEFASNRTLKDGLQSRCRQCHRAEVKASEVRNREKVAAGQRRWRKANPEIVRAHKLVSKAVAKGELVKPSQCEDCGAATRLHGHHPDHSKPLEVEWLCPPCHRGRHGLEASRAAA